MNITKDHIIDKGPKNERGLYKYYYEYDIYRFEKDDIAFIARSYTDESSRAHFIFALEKGVRRSIVEEDFQIRLFLEAVSYLLREGKTTISYLAEGGYKLLVEEKS